MACVQELKRVRIRARAGFYALLSKQRHAAFYDLLCDVVTYCFIVAADYVENLRKLADLCRTQFVLLSEMFKECRRKSVLLQVAFGDAAANLNRGDGKFYRVVKAAQVGFVDVADLVGNPDGWDWVSFEEAVDEELSRPFLCRDARWTNHVWIGEHIFNLIEQDQRRAALKETLRKPEVRKAI